MNYCTNYPDNPIAPLFRGCTERESLCRYRERERERERQRKKEKKESRDEEKARGERERERERESLRQEREIEIERYIERERERGAPDDASNWSPASFRVTCRSLMFLDFPCFQ